GAGRGFHRRRAGMELSRRPAGARERLPRVSPARDPRRGTAYPAGRRGRTPRGGYGPLRGLRVAHAVHALLSQLLRRAEGRALAVLQGLPRRLAPLLPDRRQTILNRP